MSDRRRCFRGWGFQPLNCISPRRGGRCLVLPVLCAFLVVAVEAPASAQDPLLLDGNEGGTTAVRFSPDGARLAAAGRDGTVKMWTIRGREPHEQPALVTDGRSELRCVEFSPNGALVAAGTAAGRVILWDSTTGAQQRSIDVARSDSAAITHLMFDAAGETLTAVVDRQTVRWVDVRTGELHPPTETLKLPDTEAFSIFGTYCAKRNPNRRLAVWNLQQRTILPWSLPLCPDDVFAFSADETALLLAGDDWAGEGWQTAPGGIWRIDLKTGKKSLLRKGNGEVVRALHAVRGGDWLVVDQGADGIHIYNSQSGSRLISLRSAEDDTALLDVHGDSMPMAVQVTADNHLRCSPILFAAAMTRGARDDALLAEEPAAADKPFVTCTVFYGTNRAPRNSERQVWWQPFVEFFKRDIGILLSSVAGAVLLLAYVGMGLVKKLTLGRALGLLLLLAAVVAGVAGVDTLLVALRTKPRPGEYFGNQRGELRYGTCEVSIPETHTPGELETPFFVLLENPARHIVLQQVDPANGRLFLERLRQHVLDSEGQEAFVFIHGFNVSFEDAARRTAQMAHDLKFPGAPIFFSWPSQSDLLGYTMDANNADLAALHLATFLEDIESQCGARQIHLIAHSMGAKVLTHALRDMGNERLDASVFREIILAAPDIDADYFRESIAPAIVGSGPEKHQRRVTLYASAADKALQLSQQVNGYPRAGDAAQLVLFPGIDTIDVTSFGDREDPTGHSYYGKLPDLGELLTSHAVVEQRSTLQPRYDGELPYWTLRSDAAD